MNNYKFSFDVGYDGSFATLSKILNSGFNISSVYTGGPPGLITNGRARYVRSLDDLKSHVLKAHEHKAEFELALNGCCNLKPKSDKIWWNEIRDYFLEIEDIGVDAVILSHPFLMEIVKKNTKLRLIISTICEISNVRSALYFEQLGGDVIVPSMNVMFDLNELEKIAKALNQTQLRLMINEKCLGDCPWRRFHYNHHCHYSEPTDYYQKCWKEFLKNNYLMLTNSIIRPEDLHRYLGITNNFKIVSRIMSADDIIRILNAYRNECYDGNLVDLVDNITAEVINIPNKKLEGLIDRKLNCDKNCQACRYCIELMDKIQQDKLV